MSQSEKRSVSRSNLLRLRRRLDQVTKGAALLRRRRESLVAELFRRARSAVDSRHAIDAQARTAYGALLEALAGNARPSLTALGWPSREVNVDLVAREVWGTGAIELTRAPSLVRGASAHGNALGDGGPAAELGAQGFERLLELLLEAAPRELLMRRLGDALARTTRLVNTLEQTVTPELSGALSTMRRALDEREREERLRLVRVVGRQARER